MRILNGEYATVDAVDLVEYALSELYAVARYRFLGLRDIRVDSGVGQLDGHTLRHLRHVCHTGMTLAHLSAPWLAKQARIPEPDALAALRGEHTPEGSRTKVGAWLTASYPEVVDVTPFDLPEHLPLARERKALPVRATTRLVHATGGNLAGFLTWNKLKGRRLVLADTTHPLALRVYLAVVYAGLHPECKLDTLGSIVQAPLETYGGLPYVSDDPRASMAVLLRVIDRVTNDELPFIRECVKRRVGFLTLLRDIGARHRKVTRYV